MENNEIRIPKFRLKNSLKSHYTYASILNSIITELQKIPEVQTLRLSHDLCLLCCTIVESLSKKIAKTSPSIDKKSLVQEILQKMFTLTPEEVAITGSQIDFICSNKLHFPAIFNSIRTYFF
jgi:hypothetical protein